ncbi:MAG: pyridoxamine 5'-phosphate oxidase family protein [Gammaproteobacteria bacterium]|nr:pyridoxamine 5'-phosphate oxidase family protein [Gammaproteobacteria bacterium]
MNARRTLMLSVAASIGIPLVLGISPTQAAPKGINVGGGEQGIDAVIIKGPPITAEQYMSSTHAVFPKGMTCAECHAVDFSVDVVATATRQMARSSRQLSQEQLWEKIVAFLPGRERFALTTAYNNEPLATTVDMVLDKDEKVLFVVSERGTEKLLQIRRNPRISAVHFAGWSIAEGGAKQWRSVQVKGNAEVIPSTDPRFMAAVEKYQLVRVGKERAVLRFDLIRITPEQIYYFDTTLDDNYSVYQLWKRGGTGVISN